MLVTGKGGVGKTTLTTSLARSAAAAKRRVLVAEVVPDTHNPSTLLGYFGHPRPKGDEPIEMEPGVFGVRIAPSIGHRAFLRAALRIRLLVEPAMRSSALTRFLLAAPTFPEIGVLYQLVTLLREAKAGRFDHVILDLPATGHAIGLVSLPKTVLKIVPSGLIGDAIREGLDAFTDPVRCWAIVATIPEPMPVTEANDLITALYQCGIRIGAAVLNRLPPAYFTEAERRSLDEVLEHERLLGARELARLDRASRARADFHKMVPSGIPRFEIPVLDAPTELELVRSFAEALKTAGATGESA
ncbi:MAG: arsenic transporter [Deltaproteobacteria bacterium]|nr:arsenic transporter [Deltaproteobacteria bacterium]